jgi:serine/threonine-protein kinase
VIDPGTRLAHYDIKSPLGKGGMGEVYRANDQKLGRDVAIKILPKDFAQDADRLARFQREAKLLASLNHPNIAAIHGLEYANDTHFLVLELVEGETLADHLSRGPMPVDESLKLATQIAEALQAAHEKGVIHRDLKPANIKLTHDGTVKVLDFGLAKAGDIEPSDANALSNSPTLRTLASSPGIILGTAAYMSPEQAKGRPVDRRTDVWAFGCVLYEMIAGKRAFEGDDLSDTLASVLRAEPDWSALPTATPATLRTLIQRCLAKDRAQRIADMSVVKFLLAEPAFTVSALPQSQSRLKSTLLIATVALLSIVAGGAVVWRLRPQSTAPAVVRFRIDLPEAQTFNSPSRANLAVSPDGAQIVYAANGRLYSRSISDVEAHPIRGSESNEAQVSWPIFSPDAQSIAYFTEGIIKRIPVDGGAAVVVGPSSGPLGMSWTRDGIVFAQSDGSVVRLWPDGRPPGRLLTVNEK